MKKNSLGREIKTTNIIAQRTFLEAMLIQKASTPTLDGDPTIGYKGYIFPENIQWLREEHHIDVFKSRVNDVNDKCYGLELNVLTPSEDIPALSDEEIQKSHNKLNKLIMSKSEKAIESFLENLNSFLGSNEDAVEEDNEDDEYDGDDGYNEDEDDDYYDEDDCHCDCCSIWDDDDDDDCHCDCCKLWDDDDDNDTPCCCDKCNCCDDSEDDLDIEEDIEND